MIHTLLYGIFIGVTLDFVCIVKESFFNSYMQWVVIILYWLIQVPLTFVYIYNVNEGIFHLYILLFLIVGAIIYFKILKYPLHRDLEMLGESLFKVAYFLEKVVNILVISPIMFIYKLVSDIGCCKSIWIWQQDIGRENNCPYHDICAFYQLFHLFNTSKK